MSTEGGAARDLLTRERGVRARGAQPVRVQGPPAAPLAAELPGRGPGARRRAGQPELGRDDAARRLLPPRPVRARPESRRVWEEPDLGGHAAHSTASRPGSRRSSPTHAGADRRASCCARTVDYGESLGFDADAFVYELVDGIIGDRYPGPDRICGARRADPARVPRRRAVSRATPPDGDWNLFAVEGGTAAICYIFDSLATNLLLRPGDRIALMVPAFTPYLEIPRLDRYGLDVVDAARVRGRRERRPDVAVPRLRDRQARRSRRCRRCSSSTRRTRRR